MDDKMKKVKKFGLWLVVIYAAVFAVVMSVLFLATGSNGLTSIGMAFSRGWLVYVLVGVVLIAAYFLYRWFALRKK